MTGTGAGGMILQVLVEQESLIVVFCGFLADWLAGWLAARLCVCLYAWCCFSFYSSH